MPVAKEKAPAVRFISKELRELAEKGAALYRAEKLRAPNKARVRPMSEIHAEVLRKRGMEVTPERISAMCSITGKRGGKKTADLVRAGLIDRSKPKSEEAPVRVRMSRPLKQLMLLEVHPLYK